MISIISQNPTPAVLRALRSQIFPPNAELILITRPGSGGGVAAGVVDIGAKVVMRDESINQICPPHDSIAEAIAAASNDWVWVLPRGFLPTPRALTDIAVSLAPEPGAKIHVFRAIGTMTFPVNWWSYDPVDLFAPRATILPVAVLPTGLARLANFTPGEFGTTAFLSEAARLHPSGADGIRKHNYLIAQRDLESPLREERIPDGVALNNKYGMHIEIHGENWLFYPDPEFFPLHPDPSLPCAGLALSYRDDPSLMNSYVAAMPAIFPGWEHMGIFRTLMAFAVAAAGGRAISLAGPATMDGAMNEGKRAALRDLGFRNGNLSWGWLHPSLEDLGV